MESTLEKDSNCGKVGNEGRWSVLRLEVGLIRMTLALIFAVALHKHNTLTCRDSIMVKYAVMSNYTANTSDTVLLKACYSPFSRVNRPWRNLNNVIAVCPES